LTFRPKNDLELDQLDDDDLVQYVVAAREAGDADAFRNGVAMLVYRRERQFFWIARKKVPTDSDADEIVYEAFLGIIRGSFDGERTDQFFAWAFRILRNKIADFHRRKRLPSVSLDEFGKGGANGYEMVGSEDGDFTEVVDLMVLWESALARESVRDARIIELRKDGSPAKEVIEILIEEGVDGAGEVTVANVNTIFSRFKKKNRPIFEGDPELDLDEGPGDDSDAQQS
jgi:RNA polymerase sigma factor (sigma-70 family)